MTGLYLELFVEIKIRFVEIRITFEFASLILCDLRDWRLFRAGRPPRWWWLDKFCHRTESKVGRHNLTKIHSWQDSFFNPLGTTMAAAGSVSNMIHSPPPIE